MRLVLVTLAMAAVAASAHAASPAFEAFAAACATPRADFPAVVAAANAHGWGPTDVGADANMAGVTIAETLVRATTVDKTGLVLSAWHGAKGPVTISDCAVHVAKSQFSEIKDDAEAWLAFAPQEVTAKRAVFRFMDSGGAHTALAPAGFDTAAGSAGLELLTISADANGTVLDLMMIKK